MGRDGVNGGRARVTMLPEAARGPLRDQIQYARELYDAHRSAVAPVPPLIARAALDTASTMK